ncbi:MAG: Gfo/Idh/MocA family oxidoreductase [Ruminococcaceae bacterium]|nr:Gfo/Idh/MocA family oxidoreductase [Oscillospiraceae bacterium]
MAKIRLGMIGIGNMGTPVLGYILKDKQCPEIEVTALCDVNEKRLEWAKGAYPNENFAVFTDAEEMMKSGLVDAVYIAVPHYDHPVLAMKAFSYGLHVILEKPAGVYTKAVREMNEAAKKAGVKFGIMFQSRTNAGYQEAKRLLESGEMGQLRGVTWQITTWYRTQAYYDSGSWRATWAGEGGGVLLNQCPHNLDVLQWICGMPVSISATCSVAQWHDVEIEDDVIATMKFANGAQGAFITSTGIHPGSNRLEIATDLGTIVIEGNGTKLTVNRLSKNLATMAADDTARPLVTTINYDFPKANLMGHSIVLNAFAGAILRGTPMIANGEEGINSLTLSNAMYLSDWTGQRITLPMDEDLFLEELNKRRATSKLKVVEAVYADASRIF